MKRLSKRGIRKGSEWWNEEVARLMTNKKDMYKRRLQQFFHFSMYKGFFYFLQKKQYGGIKKIQENYMKILKFGEKTTLPTGIQRVNLNRKNAKSVQARDTPREFCSN